MRYGSGYKEEQGEGGDAEGVRADKVFINNKSIVEEVEKRHPETFNKVLEFIGLSTLKGTM